MNDDEALAFDAAEAHYRKFANACKQDKIPYEVFMKLLLSHFIYGCVINDMTNDDFLGMCENAWYAAAPKIKKELDAVSQRKREPSGKAG